jgi:hypothetical protein
MIFQKSKQMTYLPFFGEAAFFSGAGAFFPPPPPVLPCPIVHLAFPPGNKLLSLPEEIGF